MRFLNSVKSNISGSRLGVSLKTPKPYSHQPLSDLRKNLQGRNYMQHDYMQQLLKDALKISVKNMNQVMDKVSLDNAEDRFATVTGWTTVSISNCADVSDEAIISALKWLLVPIEFDMFNFQRNWDENEDGSCGQFQVDSILVANRLTRLRNSFYVLYSPKKLGMELSNGLSEEVLNTVVDEAFLEAVLEAIKSRYDNTTHVMDLSRFHASPALANHFCPLHVEKFLETVLLEVRKNMPMVRTIVLSNNYLCTLKAFESVGGGFESLERLDISFNKIKDLSELEFLRQYNLEQLFVAGNGLTKHNTDQVRRVLPTLKNINGCASVKNVLLPGSKKLQSADARGPNFCIQFVTMYYDFFDEPEKRSHLQDYYHGDALFSLSVSEKLNFAPYRMYNRNHKSTQSTFARMAKLQHNSSAIILALSRLPRMQTDQPNASLDVLVYEANLRIFAITGSFTEKSVVGTHVRYFQRVFVLRPLGNPGWTIVNDMLSITSSNPKSKDVKVPLVSVVRIDDCVPMISAPEEKVPKAVNPDPVLELSLCMPKMAIESNGPLDEMPPLVPIAKLVTVPEEDLENEIDETVVSEEDSVDLIIDEDVLIGDDF